jgi:hypothetical protein
VNKDFPCLIVSDFQGLPCNRYGSHTTGCIEKAVPGPSSLVFSLQIEAPPYPVGTGSLMRRVIFIGLPLSRSGLRLPSIPHLLLPLTQSSLRGTTTLLLHRMKPWRVPRDSDCSERPRWFHTEDASLRRPSFLHSERGSSKRSDAGGLNQSPVFPRWYGIFDRRGFFTQRLHVGPQCSPVLSERDLFRASWC